MKESRSSLFQKLYNGLVLLIGTGLLAYLCFSEDGLVALLSGGRTLHPGWLLLAGAGALAELLLDAYVIYLMTCASAPGYSLWSAIKTGMIGHFYGAITPFQTGGQPMQVFFMSKQGVPPGIGSSSLLQKFTVYQSCLVAYSAVAIGCCFKLFREALGSGFWILTFAGFTIQAAIIAVLLLCSFRRQLTGRLLHRVCRLLEKLHLLKDRETVQKKWEAQLDSYHICNRALYRHKLLLLRASLLTLLQQSCLFSVSYCIYRAFGLRGASLWVMLCAQAVVTMLVCFMPLPGAAGASEGGFYFFFSLFFSPAKIKPATALWRFLTFYAVILLTFPFAFLTRSKNDPETHKRLP